MKPLLTDRHSAWSRDRRAKQVDAGKCINGHADATNGVRCFRCYLVHKHGALKAKAMDAYRDAPVCSREEIRRENLARLMRMNHG